MQRKDLEGLSREELIAKAEAVGVVRPRTLTIPELIDEILQADSKARGADKKGRGWFGRARDLLTSVIDRGLNQPGGPSRIRDGRPAPPAPPPLPTVTLAEIYAAQGHLERAVATLDEVIERDPHHADAEQLRERFLTQLHKTKPSTPPPVVEAKLEPLPFEGDASPLGATGEQAIDRAVDEALAATEARPAMPPPSSDAEATRGEGAPSDEAIAADPAEGKEEEEEEEESEPLLIASAPPPAARGSAPPPADEPALEVDEIVALSADPHTVYLYWEVKPSTLAAARAEDPDGALVVRAVTVVPSPTGPTTDVRDIRVDALFGELFVHGLPAQANVRVSVGYKSVHGFDPFAVGMDLTTPRESPAEEIAQTFRRWSEAGRAVAPLFDDPIQLALGAQRKDAFEFPRPEDPESSPPRPVSNVWIDPRARHVRVVGEGAASEPSHGAHEVTETIERPRYPGSSEQLRRSVVWSSQPFSRTSPR